MAQSPPTGGAAAGCRGTSAGGGLCSRSAACGRCSEACLAQRSEYASIIPDAPHIQGTARGKHSDRIQWMKQGAVVGCVAEPLPAAETGEAEQGQRRRPRPVDEAGSRRWRSGLNMQASSLMRRIFRAPQEERRPNMQAGGDPRCIFGQRQPGAALQFSQGRSAARRENWLSARGTRSAFCKRATSRAAKTGHRNPGGLDEK